MKRNHKGDNISCSGSVNADTGDQNKPAKNLIPKKYGDIKIKVDEDVYHLDRLELASASEYFEKLFNADFREKNINYLELSAMDSDTFSTIVDMIHGQELKFALNAENYVQLLMAMDYLQMKIDLNVYGNFIINCIQKTPYLDSNIFNLCKYVAENKNFDDLIPYVYAYMSAHLTEVQDYEEFLSLPLDQVAGIVSGQRLAYSNINDIRQCCRVCVKWIFHDVENRLSHAMKLVNAVKRRLSFPYQINIEDFKVKMRDAGEEVTPDTVLRYCVKMVAYQGEIATDNVVTQKTIDIPHESKKKGKNPIDEDERNKKDSFLKNGDFYDVVVRLEGKAYNLHRSRLSSESGYFANVFSTEISETSSQPNKDKEYLLEVEGVDQKSFDITVGYIYLEKLELNFDTIVGVLKTATVLKINSLMGECESWIIKQLEKISFEIVIDILNFIRNADLITRFENTYKCLLCQHILTAWPNIDDFSLFCAISIDMLEDLLITPVLHLGVNQSSLPGNFGMDDPEEWLNICSKWIMGDVQNRYHFIPRIALAINCNMMANCNDYKMDTALDLSNNSEQLVRDQLLAVLSSTPLIARDTLSKDIQREIKNEPVFVAVNGTEIHILNCETNRIGLFQFFNYEEKLMSKESTIDQLVSATKMGGNLFIAADIVYYYGVRTFFLSYNISSKKITSLAYIPEDNRRMEIFREKFVLLNCRDEIYCCFANGDILKYVMHLNRWTTFSRNEKDREHFFRPRFVSDAKSLYILYESFTQDGIKKIFIAYDFDQNTWIREPEFTRGIERLDTALSLTIMDSGDVAVLFKETVQIFDRNSLSWRELQSPVTSCCPTYAAITQLKDGLLLRNNDDLYVYQFCDSNRSWKKKDSLIQDFTCSTFVHRLAY